MLIKGPTLRLTYEANAEVQNLQFTKCPFRAGSKRGSIPIDPHFKIPNFTAVFNMFTAKNGFGPNG